jgi:hypothetical protein
MTVANLLETSMRAPDPKTLEIDKTNTNWITLNTKILYLRNLPTDEVGLSVILEIPVEIVTANLMDLVRRYKQIAMDDSSWDNEVFPLSKTLATNLMSYSAQ